MKARNIYKYGNSSANRIETTSHYLQLAAIKAISCSPIDFGCPWMGGLRTSEEQYELYNSGSSKADGYNNLSNHQRTDHEGKCLAIDLVPWIDGKFEYNALGHSGIIGMLMLEAWEELQDQGMIPKNKYLHWGGFWSSSDPKKIGWDMYHFEIKDKPQIIRI